MAVCDFLLGIMYNVGSLKPPRGGSAGSSPGQKSKSSQHSSSSGSNGMDGGCLFFSCRFIPVCV